MKKVCLFVHKPYQNNQIFDPKSPLNRDNCLAFFHELKSEFQAKGISLNTQDICRIDQADFVIYNEMPAQPASVKNPEKSGVFLFESELIRPNDWNLKNHEFFKILFTWNDSFVDSKKYFKFNFTHGGSIPFKTFSEKQKFCTLVAGNKKVNHPLELYSKRIESIRWFEQNHPEQFEFYGMGWDLYTFSIPVISKVLNRIKPLRKALAEAWPSYKGTAQDKLKLLSDFKFSICFENAKEIPGYITEKILDSMAAGCVPVYWGAPNISDFIPKECFILRTDFKSHEALYDYLKNMSEAEYNSRLTDIGNFLNGPKHEAFSPKANAKSVVTRLLNV